MFIKALKNIIYPLSLLYGLGVAIRNYLFESGILPQKKVSASIISIGNITAGGSGKTPAAIYVAGLLSSFGIKAGILSRGYRRKSRGYLLVSRGREILADVSQSGDEMYLAAKELSIPAAVCENRVKGAERLIKDCPVEAIVLDDAFQHRYIARDLNILMFDQRFLTEKSPEDRRLLPSGLLREPFNAVKRSDLIIINRKFAKKKIIQKKTLKYFLNKPLYYGYYYENGIFDLKSGQRYELCDFCGQKSLVVSGIARPFSFLNVLEKSGISIDDKLLFTDHKNYSYKEIELIRRTFYEANSYSVLTTEKDAVKLSRYSKELDDIDIFFLKIGFRLEDDEGFKNTLLNLFNNKFSTPNNNN